MLDDLYGYFAIFILGLMLCCCISHIMWLHNVRKHYRVKRQRTLEAKELQSTKQRTINQQKANQRHDETLSYVYTRNSYLTKDTLLNYYFRKCLHLRYFDNIFGKNDPSKEFFETICAQYNVFSAILQITSDTGCGNLYVNNERANMFFQNTRVLCIVPGDGTSPRTAYGIACMTQWNVISIDPLMGGSKIPKQDGNNVNQIIEQRHKYKLPSNLTCVRDTAENYNYGSEFDHVVLIHVHSHADFPAMWNKFSSKTRIGYTMPCCGHVTHKLKSNDALLFEGSYEAKTDMTHYYVYNST